MAALAANTVLHYLNSINRLDLEICRVGVVGMLNVRELGRLRVVIGVGS